MNHNRETWNFLGFLYAMSFFLANKVDVYNILFENALTQSKYNIEIQLILFPIQNLFYAAHQ